MRTRIKICGVTTAEAVEAACEMGADAVGFVFAESPRRVDIDTAIALAEHLSPFVTRVAVFRYPELDVVTDVLRQFRPNVAQTEPSPELVRGIDGHADLLAVFHDSLDLVDRVARFHAEVGRTTPVLLEAPGRGGRGAAPDWARAADMAKTTPVVLAGGLTPENVEEAILTVRPYAVDVSSGVESDPGIKDPRRIAEFILAARRAEQQLATTPEPTV